MEATDVSILISAEDVQKGIENLAQTLNEFYGQEEVCAVCVLKGGVIFASELVKHLTMPLKIEFIRLSSYGHSQVSSGKVNAVDISLPDLNGKNVLIIEDIIDTGNTAKFMTEFIKHNFNTKSTKFCSLLDKKVRREVDIEADFYCFEVDDKFLVGYGLDYKGYYRNLPYIGYVK